MAPAVPPGFYAPLAAHHKAIGRWLAERDGSTERITLGEARRYIEQEFDKAVRAELGKVQLADLRVVVLIGDGALPPAVAIICDSIGEIELGWITKTNVLSNTINGPVAPVGWRAAAYAALVQTLGCALPVFDFEQFLEEISIYLWDGATDDAGAVLHLVDYAGYDEEEITLPSHLRERRPDFMLAENIGPTKNMPRGLRARIARLRAACKALNSFDRIDSAWRHDFEEVREYLPHYEDGSSTYPLTLVPFDQFSEHLDEIARSAMETSFYDIVGLTPLNNPGRLGAWFETLRLGAEFLAAAQDLIDVNPMGEPL